VCVCVCVCVHIYVCVCVCVCVCVITYCTLRVGDVDDPLRLLDILATL